MSEPSLSFLSNANTTASYQECIEYYRWLDSSSEDLKLIEMGQSDAGEPIHLAILDTDREFDPQKARQKNKLVFLINNAIHAGEPCGVEASMMLLKSLIHESPALDLDEIVLLVIPMYNIGGVLNRNSTTRANQEGPESYGFRGNARNLDLNRDFIKCDSRNAQSFNKMFGKWSPDVFFDTHTSNGADYQYTMTLITTQHSKLEKPLATYLDTYQKSLYSGMKKAGWEMIPYVNVRNTPDEGITDFLDHPRYSSGYAALHQCLSFMPETHMLKPYKDRVESTRVLLNIAIEEAISQKAELLKARKEALLKTASRSEFVLQHAIDTTSYEDLEFKGFEAKYKASNVSSEARLYYDREEPYQKEIRYYKDYNPSLKIKKPTAYVIPQAYTDVIDRLQWNGVQVRRLKEDIQLDCLVDRILSFDDVPAYEGHYLHYNLKLKQAIESMNYRKGDYVVFLNQNQNHYITQTLEPRAPDSYFAWNFFDGILMQKEHFSSYIFDDRAKEILEDDPKLKSEFEKKKLEDEDFASSLRAQHTYIYQNSVHYESTHRRYPVGRVMDSIELPID